MRSTKTAAKIPTSLARPQPVNEGRALAQPKQLLPANRALLQRQTAPSAPSAQPAVPQTQPQRQPAEQIPYRLAPSFQRARLSEQNVTQAIGRFGRTPVANELLGWLQARHIAVSIVFVARSTDLPEQTNEPALGTFEPTNRGQSQYSVFVVGGATTTVAQRNPSGSTSFVDTFVNADPESIARTIFHELLHVWFINRFPSSPIPTGHTAELNPPNITPWGTIYNEENYDPHFLAKLREYDAQTAPPQNH